jgi:hypothetical protein
MACLCGQHELKQPASTPVQSGRAAGPARTEISFISGEKSGKKDKVNFGVHLAEGID